MRAFLELTGALKGTIVVALRRARPTTLAIGGAVAALVLGGLVVAFAGAGGGGADDLAGSRSGSGAGATAEEGAPSGSDPEVVDPDGRPLIDGVASRSATGSGDGGGDGDGDGGTDGTSEGAAMVGGDDAVLDVDAPTPGESTAPPVVTGPDTSPESTSTSAVDPDSSTTTEGSTTTTTADSGSSSSGGLLAGVLDLLGLG